MQEGEEGGNIRQFLETIPQFAPRFDPSRPSVPLAPEELTGLVSGTAGLGPGESQRFLESARSQDVGRRLQVTSPLQGLEMSPQVTGPVASEVLKAQLPDRKSTRLNSS